MANIGSFKKSGNDYTGSITTLSVQAKNVRIVPEVFAETPPVLLAERGPRPHRIALHDPISILA